MKKRIEDELITIGIYPNVKAFDYICEIVEEIISAGNATVNITDLYSKVAERKGTNQKSVEGAIRHALSKCDRFYACGFDKKLTNSEFLYLMAFNIKREVHER